MATLIKERFSDFMGLEKDSEIPLTEPVIVDFIYISGIEVDVDAHVCRLVGWTSMPYIGGEMSERRIMIRMAMSIATAQDFRAKLNMKLGTGH